MSGSTHGPARVVGIGASAGGVDALARLVAGVPAGLPHALCVTLHVPATRTSALAEILDRACGLPVAAAIDGEPLRGGRVYVAPPDRHLIVGRERIALSSGPREHRVRPAIDPMLRSIAECHGPAGIAVILSGALSDGVDGAHRVLRAGGAVIVQDPRDAIVASMPEHAVALVDGGALLLAADAIGPALAGPDGTGRPATAASRPVTH
jgi:two-component system chemotaxis response regulator CheB